MTANQPATRTAAFLAHPRFTQARAAYIDGYLGVYSGEPAMNKLLMEVSRHVIVTFVLCLHAAQRQGDPSTWLTLGKLQDIVAAYRVGSAGLVEAIVARMLDRGLLAQVPAPDDRRKRILVPTKALLDHDKDLIAAQAAPCTILEPKPALDLALARDEPFQYAVRTASVGYFAEAMVRVGEHAEMMLFMARDSGFLVLLCLLQSASRSESGTLSTIPYEAVADRFGVSRTHVRSLIRDAEEAGFLRIVRSGGAEIEVSTALSGHFDRWVAGMSEFFDRTCVAAYERLSAT